MNLSFTWLALGLGLVLATVLLQAGATRPDGDTTLPLLTMLIVAEFGFFLCAIGAGLGIRNLLKRKFSYSLLAAVLGCGVLAAGFLWLGLALWPGGFPG